MAERVNTDDAGKRRLQAVTQTDRAGSDTSPADSPNTVLADGERLTINLEKLPHVAYMVNYKFEVTWFNEQARREMPGLGAELPPRTDDRSIFKLLLEDEDNTASVNCAPLLRLNLALAKDRMNFSAIAQPLRSLSTSRMRMIEHLYEKTDAVRSNIVVEIRLELQVNGGMRAHSAYATYFREGMLIVIALQELDEDGDELRLLLSRRSSVIRSLLSNRLPVLTDLAVLVADLQESVKICSELPPDEYFELINSIWSTAGDIFRRYYGTYGKHVGDGMVYYFFPQPDFHYIYNAVICAMELKTAMARLSKDWQLRKNWVNELYLNTGLNEGQEWLGTFNTATSIEFVVLGDTINHTARLSDMARYGQVWATKNFMSKVQPEKRDKVEFGIERSAANGQRMLVQSSYSRVGNLVDVESGLYVKLQDIAGLAVTEIRSMKS